MTDKKIRAVGFAATPEEQRFVAQLAQRLGISKSTLFRRALRLFSHYHSSQAQEVPGDVFEPKTQGQRGG